MSTTLTPIAPLPEDIIVAEFRLVLNTDDRRFAREKAEILFAEIRGVLNAKRVALALLYDFEFEITDTQNGSTEFFGIVRLKLKKAWKDLKKKAPRGYKVVVGALIAVGAYPDVRAGSIQIVDDIRSAYEHVMPRKTEADRRLIKSFECTQPKDVKPPRKG